MTTSLSLFIFESPKKYLKILPMGPLPYDKIILYKLLEATIRRKTAIFENNFDRLLPADTCFGF